MKSVFSRGVVYMLIAVLCFALLNVCVKSLGRIPVFEVIFFRAAFSLIVTAITLRNQNISPWGNDRKWLLLRGILGTLAIAVFFKALHHIPLASLATLQYMAPLFTALSGIYLLREKVLPVQWVLLGIAMLGVILTRGFETAIPLNYFILGILSAVFSGTAYAVVRKLSYTEHPLVIVFWFPLVAMPVAALFCLFQWVTPVGWEWALLLAVGIFTQIGQVYMSLALKLENATRITSTMFLGTVVAFAFSLFWFGESYTWENILGILIICIAVFWNVRISGRKIAAAT